MQLVNQERLQFQDEKSDKVYEVELYFIQENEYIVNFRYGRRGGTLKEGTKTVFPVNKERAEKIYEDLVASKVKKGYRSEYAAQEEQVTPASLPNLGESPARAVVLSYLKKRADGEVLSTNWKLSRIIWRAGEFLLEEAVPFIGILLPTLQGQEIYSATWTLGRIASAESLSLLSQIGIQEGDLHFNIHRAARINGGNERVMRKVLNKLPDDLRLSIEQKSVSDFYSSLNFHLRGSKEDAAFLLNAYLLVFKDEELCRAFNALLRTVPLVPGYWKYIRYIYKVAEMVEDGDTFGMIASRVNMSQPYFRSHYMSSQVYREGLTSKRAKLAFSNKTRNYFITRTLRRLRKAGVDKQESYCKFAAGILLAHNEADEIVKPDQVSHIYIRETRTYETLRRPYHVMSHVPYYYYILYAQGNRYNISKKTSPFYFNTVSEELIGREDSFPELWNRYPLYAAKIVVRCRQRDAMHFGMKVLEGRPDIDGLFSTADLKEMVLHPFEEVLIFSLEIIRRRYDPRNPDKELVTALLESENHKAVALALELIDKYEEPYLKDAKFLSSIFLSSLEVVHIWLRSKVVEKNYNAEEIKAIVDSVVSFLVRQDSEEEEINMLPSETLVKVFPDYLTKTDPEEILKLLEHPRLEVQLFAAKLINLNERKPEEWPDEVILKMLSSEYLALREEGIKIFSKHTDAQLKKKVDLIVGLASSEHRDLRLQAREIIARISKNDTDLTADILFGLYDALLDDHEDEDLEPDVYETIEAHLLSAIDVLDKELEEMLRSNKREIHLLTYKLLEKHGDLSAWSVEEVARLGRHDMQKVREKAFAYFNKDIDKIKYSKEEAIIILDSDWAEARQFGMDYFDANFGENEWSPELVVMLCDSIRPEVQEYGTRVLGRYFIDENGAQYLTALSEHPDPVIQLYSTNYLDRFAFNNLAILAKLRPYFKSILSTINTRRVAKQRAFAFLEKQSQEGEAYAEYVSGILNELIGTIVVRENESFVGLLYDLKLRYPSLNSTIEEVPLEIRD